MAITYPISMPGVAANVSIRAASSVQTSASPFTYQQQVQAHQGQVWRATITSPLLDRADAEDWIAFLLKLNGPQHTFLLGDDAATEPRGSAAGTPVVDGADQTGQTLDTRGWDANETGVLLPGDYIQVGTASTSRLYKVLTQADADGSGLATLDIWPRVRDKPADGTQITTSDPVGVFRLAQNVAGWDWQPPSLTVIEFEAVEAV